MDKGKNIIRSSRSDLVSFKNSVLAKDIRRELLIWIRMARSEYHEVDNLLDKGRIDGRIEAITYVLGIIDNMIEVLDLDEEEGGDDIRRNETD